jgi:hypothetical protein
VAYIHDDPTVGSGAIGGHFFFGYEEDGVRSFDSADPLGESAQFIGERPGPFESFAGDRMDDGIGEAGRTPVEGICGGLVRLFGDEGSGHVA